MGTVTISGNSYNIYGTLADATEYLVARLDGATWTSATDDTKSRALVQGTRLIQTWLAGQGQDVDPASAVDEAIEHANYELAFALVVDSSIAGNASASNNIRRTKAGSAEIEYFTPTRGGRFPTQVQAILNQWLSEQGGSSSSGAFVSGACERSTLDADDFGLTEGY